MKNNAPRAVLYYDGSCSLCNHSVRFVARHDHHKAIRFATLQSEEGILAISRLGKKDDHKEAPGSIILFYKSKYYVKSDAALRVLLIIGGLWQFCFAAIIMPRFIRDAIYDIIAKNRYHWFGKANQSEVG